MLTGQALYFTQLGSYLLVAWWVGSKLTLFQVTFLNTLMILLTFIGMSSFAVMIGKNLALVNELKGMDSITTFASSSLPPQAPAQKCSRTLANLSMYHLQTRGPVV